jgi:ribonuclease HI
MYGWAKNGWIKSDNKTPENLDLIKGFFEIQNPNNKITLIKVKGHNGVLGNELADKLATYELTTEDVKRIYGGKVI